MIDPELAGVKTAVATEEKPKRKRAIRKTRTTKTGELKGVPEDRLS